MEKERGKGSVKTKSGKSHFVATLVTVMQDGTETRRDNFKFTAIDPEKYAEQLPKRFIGAKWVAKFENLKNLDE
jgi:hypothetical protein